MTISRLTEKGIETDGQRKWFFANLAAGSVGGGSSNSGRTSEKPNNGAPAEHPAVTTERSRLSSAVAERADVIQRHNALIADHMKNAPLSPKEIGQLKQGQKVSISSGDKIAHLTVASDGGGAESKQNFSRRTHPNPLKRLDSFLTVWVLQTPKYAPCPIRKHRQPLRYSRDTPN